MSSEQGGPSEQQRAAAVRVHRRSAPRYRVFIGLGVVVGALAAVVVTSAFARGGEFTTGSVLGYTAVLLALVGGLLGGGVAVLLDRRR
jgi:predicted phage tail protein